MTGLLAAYGFEYGGLNFGLIFGVALSLLVAAAEWRTRRRVTSILVAIAAGSAAVLVAGLPMLALDACLPGDVQRCAPPGARDRTIVAGAALLLSIVVFARLTALDVARRARAARAAPR